MNHSEPDWQEIVSDLGPCLYRYLSGIFPPGQASDLVQESLIRLIQKHRSGDFYSAKGTLKAYAFGIARYVRLEAMKAGPEYDLVEDERLLDVPVEPDDNSNINHLRLEETMLSRFLIVIGLLTGTIALAKDLSAQEIRERYQLNADVYTVDGKRIISGPESTNYWRPERETNMIKGDWSSDSANRNFQLRYRFQVLDDNSIEAVIEEYGSQSPGQTPGQTGPEFKNLLSRKEFTLANLEPIIWKIQGNRGKNLVVRFYITLREVSKPTSVDNLPLAGTSVAVSDNAGFLWAEGAEFSGRYVGLTSHRGTLALSYVPFAGAKELGEAEGNQILLKVNNDLRIKLKSAKSFLPAGVTAKVYAVYMPDKRSKGFNSLHTFTSNKEESVLEALKK